MGANKPIEDIEAPLLAATKSALLVRLRKITASRRSNLAGEGKRHGVGTLEGIGRLNWEEIIALIDLLQGCSGESWITTSRPIARPRSDLAPGGSLYDTRYGSLQFLAWLLEGWPHSTGARTARDLLARGLDQPANRTFRHLRVDWTKPRNPKAHEIEPDIRGRLREFF